VITARQQNASRLNVHQDKRLIGYLLHIGPNVSVQAGWRFIANRKDIAAKVPVPAPVFGTPDDALAHLRDVLDR